MNGAESLVRTLVGSGVEVCFANPGTSEMHFVGALDRVEGMRAVLGLFEGAVTGMADGYARMAGKPASTLLHLGPGLANGLANLHNARRASSPIVNIVGDHATYHAAYDAPLASDLMGFARPVSAWLHSSSSALSVGADAARAVQASMAAPGQIATLVLPADTAWDEGGAVAPRLPVAGPSPVGGAAIDEAAAALRSARKAAILLRGPSLQREGLELAGRIAAATGARLFCDTFAPRMQRGAGLVPVERIPYFAEQIVDFLADLDLLLLVGSRPPVSFFAYPGKPSWCTPATCRLQVLAHPHEDGVEALRALASHLGAPAEPMLRAPLEKPPRPAPGALNPFSVGQILAGLLPEGAILSDEGATCGFGVNVALATAAPHDHLALTGGSIGQGLPLAAGAAIACPDRKVVTLEGDGSGLYTLQALWTQAREGLDVTNIVFANRSYAILNIELMRVGAGTPGPKALSMFDLANPEIDWTMLARGLGVEASRATTNEEFEAQLEDAMRVRGPRLIEVVL